MSSTMTTMLHLPLLALQPSECSWPRKYSSISPASNSKSAASYPRYVVVSELVERRSDDYICRTKSLQTNRLNRWYKLHAGSMEWRHLLDPLHPWLRREIIKYGEFAQATYDAINKDPFPECYGNCRYKKHRLFDELHLTKHAYKVTKYIYAMSHVGVLHVFDRSESPHAWSKDSNWIGFVAVSTDEESERIGRRDIVMAWRGTVAVSEWISDLEAKLEPIGDGDVMVEHGFHKIYTSKSKSTRYNKLSASEQVMEEVKRLLEMYRQKGEDVNFVITGHSLGGALALLNAYEAASSLPHLPITVISFGSPQVGNIAFRQKINDMKVKTLRIVIKQDKVPTLPGELIFLTKILQEFLSKCGMRKWVYTHIGEKLALDITSSPHLKPKFSYKDCHDLEIYLHLIDGFHGEGAGFRKGERDLALVNKSTSMLIKELGFPENWYQVPNKGLVFNSSVGRWIKPSRINEEEEEDVFLSI